MSEFQMSEFQLGKVSEMLQEAIRLHFYGEILIKFEAGRIVIVKRTESIKI